MGNKRELDAVTVRDLFNPKKNHIFLYKGSDKVKQKHCKKPGKAKQYSEEEMFLFKAKKYCGYCTTQ